MANLGNMAKTLFWRISGPAAAIVMLAAASCTPGLTVYDGNDTEIGILPVANPSVKSIPGAMDGTAYNRYETFGVFAWHKLTEKSQSWTDFANAGNAGDLVTYIGGEPFAKPADGVYWAGGYNDLNISISRDVRVLTTDISIRDNTHQPKYWPKTGYLAFAGYSPYYMLDIAKNSDGDLVYDNDNPLDGLCEISYVTDPVNPYLKIEGFTQGDFDWGFNDHWATNETCDLMWFDADENYTSNLGHGGSTAEAVNVTFHHACAWLDFHLRAENETSDMKFVILKATLSDMYWSGDFVSDNGSGQAEWTLDENSLKDELILYYNMGKKKADREDKFNFITYDDYFRIDGMMILPQPVEKNGKTTTLTIYYKQLTSDTEYRPIEDFGEDENPDDYLFSGSPLTEVFTCEIPAGNGKWEMGKHYVYDIVFGLNEIKIRPSMTEWTEQTGSVTVN